MSIGILGSIRKHLKRSLPGLLILTRRQKEISYLQLSPIIFWRELNGLKQVNIRRLRRTQPQRAFGQLILSLNETRIQTQRVFKLNRRLTVLPTLEVLHAALKEFLLPCIRIARATEAHQTQHHR